MTVDLFSDSKCTVAEGPRWNGAERTLYWVDITEGAFAIDCVEVSAVSPTTTGRM